jgi:hypothetical protein
VSVPLVAEVDIRRICSSEDLRTFDPYDIWATRIGFWVKNFYNHHRLLGLPGAGALTAFDVACGDWHSSLYEAREYPVVRAWAALTLLNYFEKTGDKALLQPIRGHLQWLLDHSCSGYSGPCWGLGFHYAVGKDLVYEVNTPLATMTPYALEAFYKYGELTGDEQYADAIAGIHRYFENDIVVMEETDRHMVTSYAPFRDRRVINAVSYAVYCYAIFLDKMDPSKSGMAATRISKLYSFIRDQQRADGSWLYSPDGNSFIDCFHSCIVLKNLVKTSKIRSLDDSEEVVRVGYEYVKSAFITSDGLARRFSLSNKPSVVRYDLYDNAELLSLAVLMKDRELVEKLAVNIEDHFVDGADIYSQIDVFGFRRNKNMLRWAVMPYLHALSQADDKGLS